MYLVLLCHNIGKTEFSCLETENFDREEGYEVRGRWPNAEAFMAYLPKEFGDLSQYTIVNLIEHGAKAEAYSQQELQELAAQ